MLFACLMDRGRFGGLYTLDSFLHYGRCEPVRQQDLGDCVCNYMKNIIIVHDLFGLQLGACFSFVRWPSGPGPNTLASPGLRLVALAASRTSEATTKCSSRPSVDPIPVAYHSATPVQRTLRTRPHVRANSQGCSGRSTLKDACPLPNALNLET